MSQQVMMLQGRSAAATPAKQDGVLGIIDMLTMMRQNHFRPVVYADFYCGSGENVVHGKSIHGSPISILEGIATAVAKMSKLPDQPRFVLFNDIVSSRVMDSLPKAIEGWQQEMGLPVDASNLVCFNKRGQRFSAEIHYRAGSAQTLCDGVMQAIQSGFHVVALIDPNGPKDAPWKELRGIYDRYGKQLEMMFHLSANTLKRVAKARQAVDYDFAPMPDHIEALLQEFDGAGGWIREPAGADQWTMMLLSKHPPRSGWNPSNGLRFLRIDDPEGIALRYRLSTTAKEREAK